MDHLDHTIEKLKREEKIMNQLRSDIMEQVLSLQMEERVLAGKFLMQPGDADDVDAADRVRGEPSTRLR